ncbi:MAG: ABC transporter permease subunit [FCB group bacterium]|jgi:ABC-type glycerol-3-phosphate transport system permease component|nr:ABC transporter permease subunit [FCB group bacterium]
MQQKAVIARKVWRLVLHTVLVGGSFLFAVPFIWLIGTSAKMPDELFPPRWIPEVPRTVVESPYLGMRGNEHPVRPVGVAQEDWDRLVEPNQKGISAKLVSMAGTLPEIYGPYLDDPLLAEGLFARILRRSPDAIFTKVEPLATGWFVQNLDDNTIRDVFEQVYRRVAVANVVFEGWDILLREEFAPPQHQPWRVLHGDATLIDRDSGLPRAAQEVHYSFAGSDSFTLQAELPLQMTPEQLKRVTVSNHADRSWHAIDATLEVGGKRYRAIAPAYTGTDRWQDTIWQFASAEDRGVELRTHIGLGAAEPSDYNEPGKVRLTLDYRRANQIQAAYNKYVFNYHEVLRMVPLWAYTKNSLILVVLTITGQVLASSLVAFAFARLTWPARDAWFILVLATLMIPPQVTMIPVFLIFKELGWYNTLKPLWVGAFFGSAFYIFLLRQFMMGIPKDLEDSAKIDGCSYLGIYARIILPLVKPALATIAIFTFMATWNDFMGPLIYLSEQDKYPLSLGLFSLQVTQGPNASNFGMLMAASVMMTAPVIALFFAAQRYFIQGITLTGLKG